MRTGGYKRVSRSLLTAAGSLLVLLCVAGCSVGPLQPRVPSPRAEAMIAVAVLQLRQGRLVEAEATFEAAGEIGAPPEVVLDGIGSVAFAQRRLADAERLFERARRVNHSYAGAVANLALLREAQGRVVEADELFLEALALAPENAAIRGNYGAFLVDIGERGRGIKQLRVAQALGSNGIMEENLRRAASSSLGKSYE